ncbi:MAG TPA: IclR family transcriptional regulator [Candidatus Elarobacter sp.]|nr:IclR family transcriptional regulator [Candidatus Elarobacter sp.]
MAQDDSAYRVEALSKGLRILALFSDRRPALRLKEIAELSGLPMPTAFRPVATLASDGFLERLSDGVVRPGTAVLTLGFAALHGLDLVQTSSVILRELADETRQTVNLGVLSGDEVLYVVRLYGNALVTANVTVGSRLPAVVTSMGKALLASLSDDALADRLDASSFAGTWGTNAIGSITALRKQLPRIRADGYAVQDEELAHGLRSIAASVRQQDDIVAAVNIAVPAAEFTVARLVKTLRGPLLRACAQISARLGARP